PDVNRLHLTRIDEAKALCMKALEQIGNDFGRDCDYALDTLAKIYASTGELDRAVELKQKHVEWAVKRYGKDNSVTAMSMWTLGIMLVSAKKLDEAEPLLVDDGAHLETIFGAGNGR